MQKPRFSITHPDYRIECEAALEDEFISLMDRAANIGWDARTVAHAMKSLATNNMLGRAENAETSRQVETL